VRPQGAGPGPGPGPAGMMNKEKPAGYDERRRQRELEQRRNEGGPERRDMGPDRQDIGADRRGGAAKDFPEQHDKRTVIRNKMYADKMQMNNKKNYDYNNRGKQQPRSPSNENDNYNRRSRESSVKSNRRQDLKRSLSRDRDGAKRRKRRDSSSERERALANKGSVGNLKELEFRARALQSLITKKEESNKAAYTRRDKR